MVGGQAPAVFVGSPVASVISEDDVETEDLSNTYNKMSTTIKDMLDQDQAILDQGEVLSPTTMLARQELFKDVASFLNRIFQTC